MKRLGILTLTAASTLLLTFASYVNGQDVLKPTDRAAALREPVGRHILRTQRVEVDFNVLRSEANGRMVIPVFDGQSLTVVRDRQVPAGQRGFVWHGRVADQKLSAVTLSVVGDVVVGSLTAEKGQMYHIGFAGNGVHFLTQVDPAKYPVEDYPYQPRPKPTGALQDTCSTDPPSDIDVLVVYTADARVGAGGADAMEATIYLAVEETNQSYINSGINQRLRLAHFEEVSYTESGNLNTDVNHLQNPSDGAMDNVHTLRNTYAADVTALIVENGGAYCGMAYDIMSPVSNAFESSAFAVVARDCATGYYSFGHELGHLMSARHDWYMDSTNNSPYAYNHGYVMKSPSAPATPWRTIMAYGNDCGGCTRVQYWSNPNVNYPVGNDPMGVGSGTQQSDNRQTLNNTASTVANFRCSSPGVAHVWAKDTWNDTGAEPDPHTASEVMWESPYIWVRNAQDTGLTHQHEHQNPIYGQTNWVYAKLHNGKASTVSGDLKFYWADGSTALQWPADWHLLKSVAVSGLAAHSTRIVEAQWSTLPGKGHFCLLARFISPSDPLTTPETTNVDHNVRYNNKIVWHNVNIVDMGSSDHVEAMVNVANLTNNAANITLAIHAPEGEPNFLKYGTVRVELDRPLLATWRQAGAKGAGFHQDERQQFVVQPEGATLENIRLRPRARTQVKVVFDRQAGVPKQMFRVRVVQLKPAGAGLTHKPVVIGGTTYEIHTDQIPK